MTKNKSQILKSKINSETIRDAIEEMRHLSGRLEDILEEPSDDITAEKIKAYKILIKCGLDTVAKEIGK